MTGVTYEEIAKNPNMPKTRGELISKAIKKAARDFVDNIGKRLIYLLIISVGIGIVNLIAYVISRTTYYASYDYAFSQFENYFLAVPEIIGGKGQYKGFDQDGFLNSVREVVSLDFVMLIGIIGVINRYRKVGMKVIKDVPNAFKIKKAASTVTKRNEKTFMFRGFMIAFLVGLLLKNPFAIVMAALFLIAEVGKGKDSDLFGNILMWRITGNIKKEKKQTIIDADVLLDMFWLAIGMVLYVPIMMILWDRFNYGTGARIVVTVALAGLFWYLGYGNVSKKQKVVANVLLFICLISAFCIFINSEAYAGFFLDDTDMPKPRRPKRSGSGLRDFKQEVEEASEPSFFRGAWAAISLAASQVYSQIKSFFTLGLGDLFSGISDATSQSSQIDQGIAAYQSALSAVPGLGEQLGGAIGGIDSAMNGTDNSGGGKGVK